MSQPPAGINGDVSSKNGLQSDYDKIVYGYVVAHHHRDMSRYQLDLVKRCLAGEDVSEAWPPDVDLAQQVLDEAFGVIWAGQQAFRGIERPYDG